jgi:hypothetical protein
MKSLSAALRTNLVPPRFLWIAEGIGAVAAGSVALACGPDFGLMGLTATVVALGLAASSVSNLARQSSNL